MAIPPGLRQFNKNSDLARGGKENYLADFRGIFYSSFPPFITGHARVSAETYLLNQHKQSVGTLGCQRKSIPTGS